MFLERVAFKKCTYKCASSGVKHHLFFFLRALNLIFSDIFSVLKTTDADWTTDEKFGAEFNTAKFAPE